MREPQALMPSIKPTLITVQVPKLAMNRDDLNIALRRDHSNVTLSELPQVCDLTCERIVDRKRIWNYVEQWLQLGNNRGGFCPSKRIKNLTHGAGAGREAARQSTEPGVRVGNVGLEHQGENVADRRAVRIECGPWRDVFAA